MASIIDEGVNAGDMNHIYTVGFYMVIAAAVGLFAGVMGGKYGASASTGFARNLRRAMFARIQTYSFENIDKFSTAGLVHPSDHGCDQPAERVSDDSAYGDQSAGAA